MKKFLMLIVLFFLFSCSSPKDIMRVYDAYKCSQIASMLGQKKQADIAMKKVEPELARLEEKGSGGTLLDSMLDKMFIDDVGQLYQYRRKDQFEFALKRIYNSRTCQALYK